jgi:uncharacterized protein YutE (UPF0331/DUF86 family)
MSRNGGLLKSSAGGYNRDQIGNAKYHFVIAIETCIDIANHIIASENYRFPA